MGFCEVGFDFNVHEHGSGDYDQKRYIENNVFMLLFFQGM